MKSTRNKTQIISGFSAVEILIVIVVVGLLAGLGYTAYNQFSGSSQNSAISTSETLESSLDQIDDILDLAEIQNIAVEEISDSEIVGLELEVDDGVLLYVVHYANGASRVFNAANGEIVQLEDNDNDEIDDSKPLPANFVARLTIQEAIRIAQQQRTNSQIRKVEIELENGVVVYSIRFTDESRVSVRATDGEIQRLRDETGEDIIKLDDDFDNDGKKNGEDSDDDNDGRMDDEDDDDDNDGRRDSEDDDDDNDGKKDVDDDDDDEDRDSEDDDEEDEEEERGRD